MTYLFIYVSNYMNEQDIIKLIEKELGSKQFTKEVKKVVADVLAEFFKVIWQKKSNWYNDIQK